MFRAERRILYLVPDLFGPPGGIARYSRLVIQALQSFPVNTRAIALMDKATAETRATLPAGNHFTCLPCSGSRLRFLRQSLQVVLTAPPHLILVGHPNFAGWGWLLARLAHARLLTFIYGIDAWQPLSSWRRWGLRHSHQIITISRFTGQKAIAANTIPATRLRVLPNCLDPALLVAPAPPQPPGTPVLLTVARITLQEQYKGHDVVIQALPTLLAHHPDLTYHIVGDGDGRPALQALAQRCGVADSVHFHGFVSETALIHHYQHASIFVMPSRAEGFGFVFLEAMAYGLPVVGGNADATTEVVQDGVTGLLVEPTSVTAVADAIAHLLANDDLRLQLGQAGCRRALTHFTFDSFQYQLKNYLSELLPL